MLRPEIIEIEQKMENYENLYLNTVTNFVKWTTAFAVGVILWFGNFLISGTIQLTYIQLGVAFFALICFIATIISSIFIFYDVTKYWKESWTLNFKHRKSLMNWSKTSAKSQEEAIEIGSEKSSDKPIITAKSFDNHVKMHMVFLISGFILLIFFIGLILTYAPECAIHGLLNHSYRRINE